MSSTPTGNPVRSKLSSGLKERLKRCGRYHASPEPVAKQPKIPSHSCIEEEKQELSIVTDLPVSSSTKRQRCVDRGDVAETGIQSHSLNVAQQEQCKSNDLYSSEKLQNEKTDCSLDQTPLSKMSRSCFSGVKGSKLQFEDDCMHKLQSTEDVSSCITQPKTADKCDSVEPRDDLAKSRSRVDLVKELALKEEQLRKLKMVKMYRSKNNLEELQTLINKWRDVSQQALQDLHAAMPEPRPPLTELINHLGVDHQLVRFSAEEDETFY